MAIHQPGKGIGEIDGHDCLEPHLVVGFERLNCRDDRIGIVQPQRLKLEIAIKQERWQLAGFGQRLIGWPVSHVAGLQTLRPPAHKVANTDSAHALQVVVRKRRIVDSADPGARCFLREGGYGRNSRAKSKNCNDCKTR
ncbi:hypothetical protein [Pararhizobium sp.]|uniref:hypothetical protein n=1 Tax=Pararhizobium sp. TaxID=1977563 RepID=UPI003D0C7A50